LTEIRCLKCNRLLFRAEDWIGKIEIKCPKCGFIDMISICVHNGRKVAKALLSKEMIKNAKFDAIGYEEKRLKTLLNN